MMEQDILSMILTKETIFFGLFLFLFWNQHQEKKEQNVFILKQQEILGDLTGSFEKLTQNQEKLTERIEKIEINIGKIQEKDDV